MGVILILLLFPESFPNGRDYNICGLRSMRFIINGTHAGIQSGPKTAHTLRRITEMRKFITCLILVLAAASPSLAGDTPESTVTGFYNAYVKLKTRGIPAAKDLAEYKPYITPELAGLLKSADDAEIKYKADTKGEVPPLVEGDIFTSLFEGADSFKVLSCEEKGDKASCSVEFKNTNPGDGKTFTWKDSPVLEKGKFGWLINDVEYKGDWDFAVKGDMTGLLKGVIKEGSGS